MPIEPGLMAILKHQNKDNERRAYIWGWIVTGGGLGFTVTWVYNRGIFVRINRLILFPGGVSPTDIRRTA